jgi:hypothetical protein
LLARHGEADLGHLVCASSTASPIT